mgnify:CR=1 FL=1
MTTTTDRLDRLVNELFRKFEEMCKQRFEQETHKSQTDDTADWQQKYYQEQEARWYPWVACSIILFAVVALIVKHFF